VIGFDPPGIVVVGLAFFALGIVAIAQDWSILFIYAAIAGSSLAAVIGYDRWYERRRR
jgi:hypothetical protein